MRFSKIIVPYPPHQTDCLSHWVLRRGDILTHQKGLGVEEISLYPLIEAAQVKAGTSITSQVEEVHSISIANGLPER